MDMEVSEGFRCASFKLGPMLLALLVACGEQEEIECPPGYFNAGGTCVEAWAPPERQAPTSEPADRPLQYAPKYVGINCPTKDLARTINERSTFELMDLGCTVASPGSAVVGEEDGLVRLRMRDGSTRWTAYLVELDLPESRKREIFTEVVRAEDRADREAEQRYPVTCATKPGSRETLRLWSELTDELSEKYRNEVLDRHGLTSAQWLLLSDEALSKGWPLPPPPDPCR